MALSRRALRLGASFAGVAMVTFIAYWAVPVNATTVGFAYLLLVLVVASTWGFLEAALSSILASLLFNFFFFPPVGTFTIADSQNWVALFSFLSASLIASRLSAAAKRRTLEAIGRQKDLERLYRLSRAILLIERTDRFAARFVCRLAEIFELSATLYEPGTGEYYRAGSFESAEVDDQLRRAAFEGITFSDNQRRQIIAPVPLGSEVIASLALQGVEMPDSVLQGIVNLVAIGMERARTQDLAEQVEAARQTEQLRTTVMDAMAHEFKTPLTLIKGVTTALLANPDELVASRIEQLTIADEEANHLGELIDNAMEMARLDTSKVDIHLEHCDAGEMIREVVTSMQNKIDGRPLEILIDERLPMVVDRRLMELALKQLIDNALKYSPPDRPVAIRGHDGDKLTIEITDCGDGIPAAEQSRIFERFYRSPSVKDQIPGSGLGLSIAHRILQAHNGDLTVMSQPGETTLRITLPANHTGGES
jgi:two-component system, OmpR family, sensor histidine kinase KdpD